MESLLRWGIENTASANVTEGNQAPPRDISKLDPGIIDHILGKSEAVQMKEALAIATDEKAEEDVRVAALDGFEMLIEHIDNANSELHRFTQRITLMRYRLLMYDPPPDITSMNMWGPLLKLLESPSEAIKLNTLWVLGTAVQNNPKAQEDFLAQSPLSKILSFVYSPSGDFAAPIRSKAVYCLSGALRHNRAAVQALDNLNGWQTLKASLSDKDIGVRRKMVFLLNSLLLPDGERSEQPRPTTTSDIARDAMFKYSLPSQLIDAVVGGGGGKGEKAEVVDTELEEKAARAIMSYLETDGKLQSDDSRRLLLRMEKSKGEGEWGLTQAEWDELKD